MSAENALLHCDLCSEGKARGLRWGDTGALRLSGEISWKKTQQVQGFWDRTSWAEAPSCIHSLGGVVQ